MNLRASTGPTIKVRSTFLLALPLLILSILFLMTPYPYLSLLIPIGVALLTGVSGRISLLFYLVIITIPFFKFRTLSQQYQFLKLDYIITAVLLLIIIGKIISEKKLPEELKTRLWIFLGLFLLVNLISSLLSPYMASAFSGFNTLIIAYTFVAICLICVDKKGFESILPLVICASSALAAIIGAMSYILKIEPLLSPIEGGYRAEGVTSGANNMALMCIFCLPIISHFLLYSQRLIIKIVYGCILACILSGLITSFSRGGFIIGSIIILLIFIQNRKVITIRNFGLFIAFTGLFVFFVTVSLPEEYLLRQKSLTKGTQADTSTQRRALYLKVGIRSFKSHPLLGTGTYTFPNIWASSIEAKWFRVEPRPAHNTYMDVLVGTGLVGLSAFVLILYYSYRSFSLAQNLAIEKGNNLLASLIGSYKLSFLSIVIYFFFKSAVEHKLFLISLALSALSLRFAKSEDMGNALQFRDS